MSIVVNFLNFSEVKRYLECDVNAVDIPLDDDYPPFIIDGASGVGKTQQAFALLKTHKSLNYVNLANNNQLIYRQMASICNIPATVFQNAMSKIEARTLQGTDPFSTANLQSHLYAPIDNVFGEMLINMRQTILTYNDTDGSISTGSDIMETHDDLIGSFKDIILFIDEALPYPVTDKHKNLFRFLRNTGRTLKMRVVAAGTAATSTNMIENEQGNAASRKDVGKSYKWTLCHFYWKPMKEGELHLDTFEDAMINTNDFKGLLLRHRPLVIKRYLDLLRQDGMSIVERLENLGDTLTLEKNLLPENMFVWLTGVWLEQTSLPSSPYLLTAPDLVRNHFFEPAMLALDNGMPHVTNGSFRYSTISSPLTVTIYNVSRVDVEPKERRTGPLWMITAKKSLQGSQAEVSQTALATSYDHITNSMAYCAQQCLAREPLLAIALSFYHRLNVEEFHKSITACYHESHAEYSLGAMSGEHLELITFAALQLANGNKLASKNKLPSFVDSLIKYLSPLDVSADRFKVKQGVLDKWGIENVNYRRAKQASGPTFCHETASSESIAIRRKKMSIKKRKNNDGKEIRYHSENPPELSSEGLENDYNGFDMPWMVPSCSIREESKVLKTMFSDVDIAALVPGRTNASCDISAYSWPPNQNSALPKWKFDVKGRSSEYSQTDGIKDLVKKCGDDDDILGLHHAMLIAVRGQLQTEQIVWKVNKGGEWYFRIVLLIPCM